MKAGFTIIEIMVALLIFGVLMAVVLSSITLGASTSRQTEQRTLATRAAETWADRYRGGLEPRYATSSCKVQESTLTCTYPKNYAYPASEWAKWDDDFRAIMRPFAHTVKLTILSPAGSNVQLDLLEIKTNYGTEKEPHIVPMTTKVVY